MFTLNGNRRPAPSFIVSLSMKKGAYVMPHLQKRILVNGIQQMKRLYGDLLEKDVVKAFSSMDVKISVNILQSNLERMDRDKNHILYNIVQNKHKNHPDFGSVAHIYVIPTVNLVSHTQFNDYFIAKMQPDCVIESREEMKMTNIFKFPRRTRGEIFVKSKAEADYFSKENQNAPYETVQALRVGTNYLVNDKKVKISNIKTDLHTIRCLDNESVAKEAFGTAFKFTFTGANYTAYSNVNVKNLNPGLYRCLNRKEGYMFVEIFNSAVTGKVRMVHFLDEKQEKTAEMLLKYKIQTAWTNPVY